MSDNNQIKKLAKQVGQYPTTPGNRRRYFDHTLNSLVVWVGEGDCYISSSPYEVLSTLLGSCVAVCMRDPEICTGGMNHFLLPENPSSDDELPSFALRYGSHAIESLTNALVSRGAQRSRIEVKVFGGANIRNIGNGWGHANANFVENYLKRERLNVLASDLRGTQPRRLRYFPATGRAQLSKNSEVPVTTLAAKEFRLAKKLKREKDRSSIEIFDPRVSVK